MTVKRAVLSTALAVALGLEIISPSREDRTHVETEVILAETKTIGTKADALRPVVTPPRKSLAYGLYALRH
jgi:hypothetical protein